MALRLGTGTPAALRVGVAASSRAYVGSTLVWEAGDGGGGDSPLDQVVPYAAGPWRQTLDEIYPNGLPIYSGQAAALDSMNDTNSGKLSNDVNQFTYPVYLVDEGTPVRRVFIKRRTGGGGGTLSYGQDPDGSVFRPPAATFEAGATQEAMELWVRVPDGASSANGSDAQIIFWDPVTGDEWAFWQFLNNGDGTYSSSNGYRYNTNWNGVPKNVSPSSWNLAANGVTKTYEPGDPEGMYLQSDGTSPTSVSNNGQWLSRGAGVTYLAGLIRPWELDAGIIRHPIAFAYNSPSSAFVYPATKSDGLGVTGVDVPEGARLFLRRDYDLSGLTPDQQVIGQAMKDYGLVVIDHSGATKIYLESVLTAPVGWASRVPTNLTAFVDVASDLRVIDWTAPMVTV